MFRGSQRNRRKLILWTLLAGGTTFQVLQTNGCAEFATSLFLNSVDFCSFLNCTGGSFFNFCEPVAILTDCLEPA